MHLREVVRDQEDARVVDEHIKLQVLGQEGVRKGLDGPACMHATSRSVRIDYLFSFICTLSTLPLSKVSKYACHAQPCSCTTETCTHECTYMISVCVPPEGRQVQVHGLHLAARTSILHDPGIAVLAAGLFLLYKQRRIFH